jgi:hypothetical protein
MSDFSLSFDPGSLAAITKLEGFSALLKPEIQAAVIESGRLLTEAAQAKTWEVFANPTGALAESIYPWLASPYSLEVRVGVPYGRRREYGFSGLTDSLGRYYVSDPGKPYLAPTIEEHQEEVRGLMATAVERTFSLVGAI